MPAIHGHPSPCRSWRGRAAYVFSLPPALCLDHILLVFGTRLSFPASAAAHPVPPPGCVPSLFPSTASSGASNSIFRLLCCSFPSLSPPLDHEFPCLSLQQNSLSYCSAPVSMLGSRFTKVTRHGPCPQGVSALVGEVGTEGGEIAPGRGVRERREDGGPHEVSSIAGGAGVGEGRLGKL